MTARSVCEALASPEAYPCLDEREPKPAVERLETHVSRLWFAGERVYKTKKPVDLGFLDYRDLEQRHHYCEEEVRLGRRLGPDVYLGVVAIRRDADGRVRVEGPGELVDWAVEMQRLPAHEMLDAKLARGEIDNALLEQVAALLVRFHADAATGPGVDEYGTLEAVRANTEENWRQLRPWIAFPHEATRRDALLSSTLYSFLKERCRAFLAEHAELFASRVRAGRIREGHGDLHAGNLCFTPRGPVAYDPIEFNRRFRCGDVAADLAFLVMDLDAQGYAAFGAYLARRYAELSGDADLARLLPFYKGYRAVVRAKVAALRSEGLAGDARRAAQEEARGYLHLAAAYELPPALVLMCGLPGCGKTWVARRLRRALHAQLHQSDVRRRHLLAAVPDDARYGPAQKARTYRELLEVAAEGLEAGRSVIVDATFSSAATRRPFLDLAARLGLHAWVVWVAAPEALVRERLAARAADTREASEADYAVYLAARETFEPPDELPPGHVVRVTSRDQACQVPAARLLEHMITLAG